MEIPVIQHPPIVKKASSKRPLVLFAPVGKMNSSVSCGNMTMTAIHYISYSTCKHKGSLWPDLTCKRYLGSTFRYGETGLMPVTVQRSDL